MYESISSDILLKLTGERGGGLHRGLGNYSIWHMDMCAFHKRRELY